MRLGLPETRNALVIAPHPDDEVLGCGGTVSLLVRAGATVRAVFVTNGERLHGGPSEKVAGQRLSEARAAAGLLGCQEPAFLGLPDGDVASHSERLRDELAGLLGRLRPELVFAPSPADHHADHIAASRAILDIFNDGPDFIVAFYEIYSTVRFTHLIDITEVIQEKKRAILSYRTSLYGKPDLFVSALLGLNSQRSLFVHKPGYFEAFWVLEKSLPEDKIRAWLTYGF